MANNEKFLKAVKQLRQTEKKVNFDQTVDLIVNLKNFNLKRDSFNIFVQDYECKAPIGIDTPEDLEAAIKFAKNND